MISRNNHFFEGWTWEILQVTVWQFSLLLIQIHQFMVSFDTQHVLNENISHICSIEVTILIYSLFGTDYAEKKSQENVSLWNKINLKINIFYIRNMNPYSDSAQKIKWIYLFPRFCFMFKKKETPSTKLQCKETTLINMRANMSAKTCSLITALWLRISVALLILYFATIQNDRHHAHSIRLKASANMLAISFHLSI